MGYSRRTQQEKHRHEKESEGVKKQNKENIDVDKLTSSKSRVDELPN
jgi:hypothetical protein